MGKIRFIATRHPEYAAGYPVDTVIDPWRYVRGARGLGRNKPELISILVPSRGRYEEHARLLESLFKCSTHPRQVQVITYLDRDDPVRGMYWRHEQGKIITGERILLSEMWNECYAQADGNILMHCGDDIIFRTPAWDSIVRATFAASQDKILLVHGDDLTPNTDALATHGFLHRRWVETVGYFVPPLFSSDWNDVWLTEVADMIGRRVKIPIVTEHMHYSFGKADRDQNTNEREERGLRDKVVELFQNTKADRIRDAAKLREVMA